MLIQQGVIVPVGVGKPFYWAIFILAFLIVVVTFLAVHGMSKLDKTKEERFRLSKIAGTLFISCFLCLLLNYLTGIIYFYVGLWVLAFFAMLYLFFFTMIPEGSPFLTNPLMYLRSRILYKLVIVLVITVVLSLEGLALITISIAKNALSETVIANYKISC